MSTFRLHAGTQSTGRLAASLLPIGLLVLGLLALSLAGGCGDNTSGGTDEDTTPPTVLGTTPTDGATDVSPYPVVQVRFSEAMDPASIDTLTFHMVGIQAGAITYDAAQHRATLYPATVVAPSTEYTVHVEPGVMYASGNAMESVVVFHFTTGALDCAHLRDRFEPDNDIASATPIEIDATYPGLTSCGDGERYDYYRFTLAAAKQIKVTAYVASVTPADTGSFSFLIALLREDGQRYAASGYGPGVAGATLTHRHTFLPGTYWIEVGNQRDDARLLLYRLKVEVLDPIPDDQYEDNDFPDQATPIEPGLLENLKGTYVDIDYYSVNLTAGQTITATATEVTSTATNYRLAIADTIGNFYTSQDGSGANTSPGVQTWTATETGKYLIYVAWWGDNVTYTLNVEVSQ